MNAQLSSRASSELTCLYRFQWWQWPTSAAKPRNSSRGHLLCMIWRTRPFKEFCGFFLFPRWYFRGTALCFGYLLFRKPSHHPCFFLSSRHQQLLRFFVTNRKNDRRHLFVAPFVHRECNRCFDNNPCFLLITDVFIYDVASASEKNVWDSVLKAKAENVLMAKHFRCSKPKKFLQFRCRYQVVSLLNKFIAKSISGVSRGTISATLAFLSVKTHSQQKPVLDD